MQNHSLPEWFTEHVQRRYFQHQLTFPGNPHLNAFSLKAKLLFFFAINFYWTLQNIKTKRESGEQQSKRHKGAANLVTDGRWMWHYYKRENSVSNTEIRLKEFDQQVWITCLHSSKSIIWKPHKTSCTLLLSTLWCWEPILYNKTIKRRTEKLKSVLIKKTQTNCCHPADLNSSWQFDRTTQPYTARHLGGTSSLKKQNRVCLFCAVFKDGKKKKIWKSRIVFIQLLIFLMYSGKSWPGLFNTLHISTHR